MAKYSSEIKNRACEIYLECGSSSQVQKMLELEYANVSDVSIPTLATIRNWINENNLNESLEQIQFDTIKKSQSRALEESMKRRQYQMSSFQEIFDAGRDGVVGPDAKEFRNPYEAAKTMEIAAEMERKLASEEINMQFIEDVFSVIKNEIDDYVLLQKIGNSLMRVLSKYSES